MLTQGYSNHQIDQMERDMQRLDNTRLGNKYQMSNIQAQRMRDRAGVQQEGRESKRSRRRQEQMKERQSPMDALTEALSGGGLPNAAPEGWVPPGERAETESERRLREWQESEAQRKIQEALMRNQ